MSDIPKGREAEIRLEQAINSMRWSLEIDQNLADTASILSGENRIGEVKANNIREDFNYDKEKDTVVYTLEEDSQTVRADKLMKDLEFSKAVTSATIQALEEFGAYELFFETDIGWEGEVPHTGEALVHENSTTFAYPIGRSRNIASEVGFYDDSNEYSDLGPEELQDLMRFTQEDLAFQAKNVADHYLKKRFGEAGRSGRNYD